MATRKGKSKTSQKKKKTGSVSANPLEILDLLENTWPPNPSPEVSNSFAKLRFALGGQISKETPPATSAGTHLCTWPPAEKSGPGYFDPLVVMRQVLSSHDLLFLSRQVAYHVAADASMSNVWADMDRVQFLFSELIEHLAKRSARGSRISIAFKKSALRSGPGMEITFSSADKHFIEADQQKFVNDLLTGHQDEISGVSLSNCRQAAVDQQGQLWIDFPKPTVPAYHLALPVSEQTAKAEKASQQTFKYDISISNYSMVRKRFGIKKSQSLVSQVEHYVRSLVRYPIDMVMALGDKGVITTIYETQRGMAQSVASRISERLGSEKFRIGKMPVDISFSYRLSPLSPPHAVRVKDAERKH